MTDSHQCPLNLDLLSVTNSDSSMDIVDIWCKPTSKGSSSAILSTQLRKLIEKPTQALSGDDENQIYESDTGESELSGHDNSNLPHASVLLDSSDTEVFTAISWHFSSVTQI